MKTIKLLMLAAAGLAATGCTTNHGRFTVLSNRLVDTKSFNLNAAPTAKNVTGRDINPIVLGFSTGEVSLQNALKDTFVRHDADLMTDVDIYYTHWCIFFFGQYGWTIKGDAVKTRPARR